MKRILILGLAALSCPEMEKSFKELPLAVRSQRGPLHPHGGNKKKRGEQTLMRESRTKAYIMQNILLGRKNSGMHMRKENVGSSGKDVSLGSSK